MFLFYILWTTSLYFHKKRSTIKSVSIIYHKNKRMHSNLYAEFQAKNRARRIDHRLAVFMACVFGSVVAYSIAQVAMYALSRVCGI